MCTWSVAVLNIYQFGSRVYECDDNDAHWSFIITMGDDYKGPANFTRGTWSTCVLFSECCVCVRLTCTVCVCVCGVCVCVCVCV